MDENALQCFVTALAALNGASNILASSAPDAAPTITRAVSLVELMIKYEANGAWPKASETE